MELAQKEDSQIIEMFNKIRRYFKDEEALMSVFSTLLGAADNVSQYVLQKEAHNYNSLPPSCKYGLLQIYQMLCLISSIVRDEIEEGETAKVGGYFPTGEGAWKSETDFEKRFILMIKLFYKDLQKQGKIKAD